MPHKTVTEKSADYYGPIEGEYLIIGLPFKIKTKLTSTPKSLCSIKLQLWKYMSFECTKWEEVFIPTSLQDSS